MFAFYSKNRRNEQTDKCKLLLSFTLIGYIFPSVTKEESNLIQAHYTAVFTKRLIRKFIEQLQDNYTIHLPFILLANK